MSTNAPSVHLNPNVETLGMSATLAINDRLDALRAEGREVFKLGLGESPFPVPGVVVEALQSAAAEKRYLPVKGVAAVREAVADHHRREFDIDRDPDDVLIGPGSKELMFLLQLVYDGDLLIPSPSWVSYAPQARIIGRDIVWLPTSFEKGWRIVADDLEALCCEDADRPRLMILNYPSNPTGVTYTKTELADLAEVARRRRVVLLSDEIYGKLHHRDAHDSIVPMYPEGTIFSGGLSKCCGAGGWRLGVFVFPRDLRWLLDAMGAVGSETFTSTCNPVQHAAVRAFRKDPGIDRYVCDEQRILGALGATLARRLQDADVRVHAPDGGFYLFPDFSNARARLASRGIATSRQLCERLLDDTGVAILPGSDFGRPDDELTARLAYVNFDGGPALEAARDVPEGIDLDEAFLDAHCQPTLTAIDRLVEWLDARVDS